ncbi:apolipoprotein N-acyltransferase [Gynuella sunshinyii]|uniref:Apolipoprotein N-acyltransferase n=1 Tax=Gynuella sunshinyii YC6258 TaxID=1445510 RepID=A0A0C5VY26_9GAMM|nr:apolipoprotein N-acyltransferase [Gynuella sunshinyii]AJQ95259.1 apolipoprotein N-acyltransferase [Gynuella sunshinyii YC6258]
MSSVKSWLDQAWFINTSALVAGALFPLSMAPLQLWPLGLLSQAWLGFLVLRNPSFSPWSGWLYGFGFFGVGFSWVYESIRTVGTAVPAAALMTLLFCMALAFLFWCQIWAFKHLRAHRVNQDALLFVALWVVFEWLRAWFLTGLPWLYSGYSMTDTWLAGYAPVIGVFGLSSLATAFAIWCAALTVHQHQKQLIALLMLTITVLAGGYALNGKTWVQVIDQPVKVVALQGNIDQRTKWNSDQQNYNYRTYWEMTEKHLDADLIVWPESAITRLLSQAGDMLAELDQLGTSSQTGIIAGLIADDINNDEPVFYNSVVGLGLASGQYNKTKLVPFGEYIPFSHALRGVLRILDIPMSSLTPGHNKTATLKMGALQLGQIICSEITYPGLVMNTAEVSNLMVIVSNDAWFGDSLGPYQHLQIVRMRAMEMQRPMVRATQDGISAIVDHHGKILTSAPKYVRTALTHELKPVTGQTPYMKFGYTWIISLWLVVVVFQVLSGWFFKRRDNHTAESL